MEKRRKARRAARRRREREVFVMLAAARRAMEGAFTIADLETTGFGTQDEIMEISALRRERDGTLRPFSRLVRIRGQVPDHVEDLTGISSALLQRRGIALERALAEFIAFCEHDPVFFHNKGFDERFLREACRQVGLRFGNDVHCTLRIARAVWPGLRSHTLEALARHIRAPLPTHRAADDVRTTLAVLTQACQSDVMQRAA
jgi:DNA polymerase-3 subunit epsilon